MLLKQKIELKDKEYKYEKHKHPAGFYATNKK